MQVPASGAGAGGDCAQGRAGPDLQVASQQRFTSNVWLELCPCAALVCSICPVNAWIIMSMDIIGGTSLCPSSSSCRTTRWAVTGEARARQCLLYRGILPLIADQPSAADAVDATDRQLEFALQHVRLFVSCWSATTLHCCTPSSCQRGCFRPTRASEGLRDKFISDSWD